MERQCWAHYQYSRREFLETSGIPENVKNKDLESLTLKIFEKIYANVDPANVEDCHWVNIQAFQKKMIIKFSKGNNANKVRAEKKAEG